MLERTRRDAVRVLRQGVHDALSCLVEAHVHAARTEFDERLLRLRHSPVAAKLTSDFDLALVVEQYHLVERTPQARNMWAATIAGYTYRLLASGASRGTYDREVYAYHYHPIVTPAVPFPHMHVRWNLQVGKTPISKCHFPTGHVALEDFLHLLVRDFGVRPRRPDWESVLARTASQLA